MIRGDALQSDDVVEVLGALPDDTFGVRAAEGCTPLRFGPNTHSPGGDAPQIHFQ